MPKNKYSPRYIIILDTSAILNLVNLQKLLPKDSEIWLPRAVLQEIVSREGSTKLAVLNETLNPIRVTPEPEWIQKTVKIARKIGINSKLSKVDIEVLATCLWAKTLKSSKEPLLLTDDRWMQNFAIQTNISFKNIRFQKAKRAKKWVFQCISCKNQFPEGDQPDCPICGGSLQPKQAE